MKKGKKPVQFSVHERRVHGLPIKGDIFGKDAEALRKILDAFPWMTEIAEHRFDPGVKDAYVVNAYLTLQGQSMINAAIEKKNRPPQKPDGK